MINQSNNINETSPEVGLIRFINTRNLKRLIVVLDAGSKLSVGGLGLALAGFVIYCGIVYADPFNGPGLLIPAMTVIAGMSIAVTSICIAPRLGLHEIIGIDRV